MGNAVQQANAIQCAQTLSATVSIVACVIMLRKVMGERKSNIANRMLIYLLFIDFVLALCYAVGRGGQSNARYCQFQVRFLPILRCLNSNFIHLGITHTMVFNSCNVVDGPDVVSNASVDRQKEKQ